MYLWLSVIHGGGSTDADAITAVYQDELIGMGRWKDKKWMDLRGNASIHALLQ